MYTFQQFTPDDMCTHCKLAKLMHDGWVESFLAPLDCPHETWRQVYERELEAQRYKGEAA